MHSATVICTFAILAGAMASQWANQWPNKWQWNGPNSDPAAVAAARSAHLAEFDRIRGERLAALAAANAGAPAPAAAPAAPAWNGAWNGAWAGAPAPAWAWAGNTAVVVQAAPQPITDNADVAQARQEHLGEVARQNAAALAALARVGVDPAVRGSWGPWASAAEVEAARAAHLAEFNRIRGERLGALAAANAKGQQWH